eukprot:TRINITY_DN93515_c0_g1_i1.p1 TRINITY_DN93515_c0_g1~~TRINITY_DN93515_c0_g1_i1.p1  ORF type:complete len:229 (-),score=54.79 TRINITY_DN93515_c0_g1_i1:437-1123(-)
MSEAASKNFLAASALYLQEDAASTALASSQEDSEGDSQRVQSQKLTWADISESDDELDEEVPAERSEALDKDGWTTVGSRAKPKCAAGKPTSAPSRSWATVVSEAARPARDAEQKGWHESSVGKQAAEHQNKAVSRSGCGEQQKRGGANRGHQKFRACDSQQKPRSEDHKGYWQEQQNSSASASKTQDSQGKPYHHGRKGDWQKQSKRSDKPASTDDWLSKRMGATAS